MDAARAANRGELMRREQVGLFLEQLPEPMRKTEEGPEELLAFDPTHNTIRYRRAVPGQQVARVQAQRVSGRVGSRAPTS